jgi:uncharacterized protein YcbX
MAGEALDEAMVGFAGLVGDRRWAFVRFRARRSGFPWQTIRENPAMCRYVARLIDPARPNKSAIEVKTPTGETMNVTDPALARKLGLGLRVMRLDRGLFDAMPVSLISSSTVSALCDLAEVPGNELRFRPNIVIDPIGDRPFVEDEWVGSVLQVGGTSIRIDKRDTRCVILNVDPDSGRADAAVLKKIPRGRRACAGVYASTVQPGLVRVGDPVTLAP